MNPGATAAKPVACTLCKRPFPSRNVLFRHLRDPSNDCGNQVLSNGGIAMGSSKNHSANDLRQSLLSVQGASLLAKEKASGRSGETRVQSKKKSKRKKHSSTDEFTTAHQQELWMGGIPSNYATEKAVSRILWGNIRSGEPVPVVKIVVRKGWRGKRTGASDEGGATREKQWVGYAIIAFATEEDAAKALTLFQGRKLEEGFTMRLKPAQPRKRLRRGPGGEGAKSSQGISFAPLNPEEDPPLESQLMPLRTEQLVQRLSSLQKFYDSFMADTKFPGKDTKRRIEQIATCTPLLRAEDTDGSMRKRLAMYHASVSVRTRRHKGKPVPPKIRDTLLLQLQTLRWPTKRHRKTVNSQQYLVICRGRTPYPDFAGLHASCEQLMQWADSAFAYTHIAVTKNFDGSPHTDNLDTSYQYTISLGDFTLGGQLCVEQPSEENGIDRIVEVVDTHDKIACCDGRYVHWVRGHGGGDRYSLVFFTLDPDVATAPDGAVRMFAAP